MQIEDKGMEKKWSVFSVTGRIDGSNAMTFEKECMNRIDTGVIWLALDLAGVPYVCSAGLRGLLAALKRVHKSAGAVALINPHENVREVLSVTGFGNIFQIVSSTQELT